MKRSVGWLAVVTVGFFLLSTCCVTESARASTGLTFWHGIDNWQAGVDLGGERNLKLTAKLMLKLKGHGIKTDMGAPLNKSTGIVHTQINCWPMGEEAFDMACLVITQVKRLGAVKNGGVFLLSGYSHFTVCLRRELFDVLEEHAKEVALVYRSSTGQDA